MGLTETKKIRASTYAGDKRGFECAGVDQAQTLMWSRRVNVSSKGKLSAIGPAGGHCPNGDHSNSGHPLFCRALLTLLTRFDRFRHRSAKFLWVSSNPPDRIDSDRLGPILTPKRGASSGVQIANAICQSCDPCLRRLRV